VRCFLCTQLLQFFFFYACVGDHDTLQPSAQRLSELPVLLPQSRVELTRKQYSTKRHSTIICSCFSTGPVKEVPRTDPRHTSLDPIPSLHSHTNRLFTSMLKVMTTLFPSLVTGVWVLKTKEGCGAKEEYRQVSFYAISFYAISL
jgi:hypothetical protein